LALTHVRSWLALPSVDPIQPGPRHLDILASFSSSRKNFPFPAPR